MLPSHGKRGDSSGRLIAQQRAQLLSEAGLLSELLQTAMERAGASLSEIDAVAVIKRELQDKEQAELLRAHGRIEGRERFRKRGGSGNPVADRWPTHVLYVDESGRADPASGIEESFVLGAVAMSEEDRRAYAEAIDDLKHRFFGTTEVSFHETKVRSRDGVFGFSGNAAKYTDFITARDVLIDRLNFTAFAAGIRKGVFVKEYRGASPDPYMSIDVYPLAIKLLLERFLDFLAFLSSPRSGAVTMESQGAKENAEHQLTVAETLLRGTQWISEAAFRKFLLPGVLFQPKGGTSPLELSDMLAYDVAEWMNSNCKMEPARWDLWGRKLYRRGNLRHGKFGLKIFPTTGIDAEVEAHRDVFR